MSTFLSGIWVILTLELRQRVRGVSSYVLLGSYVVILAIVTVLLTIAYAGFGESNLGDAAGAGVYSAIIYFVLLLGTLVAPALSGNAINGDRDAGTLATTQITLISTWQLVLGKFVAAWITALAFLVVSLPFILYASFLGGLSPVTVLVSTLVLAVELGVVAAIGVGLSGILTRPLFSIVLTYLTVAALSVGTLIAFGLGGLAVQTTTTTTYIYGVDYDSQGRATECADPEFYESQAPRFDLFWGVLVANPYVLLADAVPTTYDQAGYPQDLFGSIKYSVRQVQIPPSDTYYDECSREVENIPSAREVIDSTVPGWFVGLVLHLALAAGALIWAWSRTNTPTGRLPKGSRVA
ncbi:ABC-type transport system involved in multi-copper enzyme maturation permease subunit [Conyzicola lurida]|uniref:ABC-type transport system involved in multi-copper enzyme maturation permease subunit n=1 Tax=Conyzicola lurida TaxID=1172621 RepID=A0A841AKU7_9MICO|nr:ABC transporter permease [Conyzicola lurida]MBB5842273.1 ABC-type transport system involved in multi-copper enzyme maturation permease subunit [Conyzicola lurida]